MANTYNWDCKTVDVYPTYEEHSDTVYNVHWRLNAESSETHEVDGQEVPYTASVYGTQSLSLDDIGTDFVPFADLTNAVVTGWVEGIMGEEEVANLKSALDAKISEEITPTTETKTIGEQMEGLIQIIVITGVILFIIYKKKPEWIELIKSKFKK